MPDVGLGRFAGRGEIIDFVIARRRRAFSPSRQIARWTSPAIPRPRIGAAAARGALLVALAYGVAAVSAPLGQAFGVDAQAGLWLVYGIVSAVIYNDLAERAPLATAAVWTGVIAATALIPAALPGALAMAVAFGGALLLRRKVRA